MSTSEPIAITSTRNPRIVQARKLYQRKHRERQGRFLVEGLQLLHMALDAGHRPIEALYCPEQFAGEQAPALLERLTSASTLVTRISANVMGALSQRDAPQGMLAVFALFGDSLASLDLTGDELVLVIDRLQDPGNLGTLIRTADAVGATAVVLIEPCVDLFDLKTIRATMGSCFNLPLIRTSDPEAVFALLHERGLRAVGADAADGTAWGEGLWQGGVALVVGNEARGLSPDIAGYIQERAKLPMIGKAESLNVAIAGGVLMYAWLRENLRGG